MTVKELLLTMDSQELSEWYVLSDLKHWQEQIDLSSPEPLTTETIINTLFPTAMKSGNVVWQTKEKL